MTATDCTAIEQVILVDEQDRAIGTAEKLLAHQQNLLHRAFSVFIFRQSGVELELLLQQRTLHKYHSGGLWTNTCCSHPRPGESTIEAGERRLHEELGITASLRDIGWFQYNVHFLNGLSEHEIDHVLVGHVPADVTIVPNTAEISHYRWITFPALKQELASHPANFTQWLAQALTLIL